MVGQSLCGIVKRDTNYYGGVGFWRSWILMELCLRDLYIFRRLLPRLLVA